MAGRKKFAKERFHIFDRVIQIGEEMEDGQIADRIYVKVSDWLLENFENNYVLPIDYELYRELRFPIAKALVPLFQIWFYAARRNHFQPKIEKRYKELSELLGIRPAKHLSKIKETLEPSLQELKQYRLIGTWDFERTVDGLEFKLVATPGDRFLTERQIRMLSQPPALTHQIESQEFTLLLGELTKRGVVEDVARRLLMEATDLENVATQIAFGDFELTRKRNTINSIKNPPGFYRFLIENDVPVPEHIRAERELRKKGQQDLLMKEYEHYRHTEAERFLTSHYNERQICERVEAIQQKLLTLEPQWGYLSQQQLRDHSRFLLCEEVQSELELMSFEQFTQQSQLKLQFV